MVMDGASRCCRARCRRARGVRVIMVMERVDVGVDVAGGLTLPQRVDTKSGGCRHATMQPSPLPLHRNTHAAESVWTPSYELTYGDKPPSNVPMRTQHNGAAVPNTPSLKQISPSNGSYSTKPQPPIRRRSSKPLRSEQDCPIALRPRRLHAATGRRSSPSDTAHGHREERAG